MVNKCGTRKLNRWILTLSVVQLKFGEFMKVYSLHVRRERASRNTSSASRKDAAPESISASLRTASSAQSCSISSSERSSRLRSSFSASLRVEFQRFRLNLFDGHVSRLPPLPPIISTLDHSVARDEGWRYLSSQSRIVLNHSWRFWGLRTQWPSSGKIRIFESIPLRCTAVNSCMPSPIGTR